VAPACPPDSFEREAALFSHPPAGNVSRIARDLDAPCAQACDREVRHRSRRFRRIALPRAGGADPVPDLELGDRPIDRVQSALADKSPVRLSMEAEVQLLTGVPLRLHLATVPFAVL